MVDIFEGLNFLRPMVPQVIIKPSAEHTGDRAYASAYYPMLETRIEVVLARVPRQWVGVPLATCCCADEQAVDKACAQMYPVP